MNDILYYNIEIDFELLYEDNKLLWHNESSCGTESVRMVVSEMIKNIQREGWIVNVEKIYILPVYNPLVYSLDEFEKEYGKVTG